MEVKAKYIGQQKFIAQTQNHKIIIDQPKDKGGTDEGMNPLEVFLAALASCAGFYAKNYCQNSGIETKDLEITVSSSLASDKPMRFQDIKVKISLGDNIADRKDPLLAFVKNCPVHNTIKSNPVIQFII